MAASGAGTLVIGASAAGLAVARCLEEAGAAVTVIDAAPEPGTMWRAAYERLHLHTPRGRSGLPYLPMPAGPRYPARQEVVDYLESYAAALRSPPRFGQRATAVIRDGAGWRVETEAGKIAARNVVVATGNTRVPVTPEWPGTESYTGRLLHASQYRTGSAFRGERVLVVGFGNSACEIAIDLVEQGASPTLSVRGAVNVIPRELFGIPIANLGLVSSLFPPAVADLINAPLLRLAVGDVRSAGLTPLPYGPIAQIVEHHAIPLIDIGTLALLRKGSIALRPAIARFTKDGVVFADGRGERFDAVVLATGYRAALGDLLAGVPGVLDEAGTPLVSGGITAAPGLYFCGFAVVPGGTLRQIGIEARRIARQIAA